MRCLQVGSMFLPGAALVGGLLAPAAAAQDLLIRRDGGRVSGKLNACAGDRCMLGGKAVPLAEIAWIGLGVGEEAPPPGGAREPGVHLADGTVRTGTMVGLSLGSVALADGSLDRALVRWICVACGEGSGGEIATRDLLIRRDGARLFGDLQGCAGVICTLGNPSIPLVALTWIGLAVDPENVVVPQLPPDPMADAVVLREGPVRRAPLVGVDATTVATQSGSFPRRDVAWIYVAPRPGPPPPAGPSASTPPPEPPTQPPTDPEPPLRPPFEEPPPPGEEPPPEDEPPPDDEPPDDDPPDDDPPPRRRPRPPAPTPVRPCPAGKPLGGWIRAQRIEGPGAGMGLGPACRATVTTQLFFRLNVQMPVAVPWAHQLRLLWEAPVIDYRISATRCHDTAFDNCAGETVEALPGSTTGGVEMGPQVLGSLTFYPLEPALRLSSPELIHHGALDLPQRTVCQGMVSESFWSVGLAGLDIGVDNPDSRDFGYSEIPVEPTVCYEAAQARSALPTGVEPGPALQAQLRDCVLKADRYAVIPFAGESAWSYAGNPPGYSIERAQTRWEVCCGCGEPPPPGAVADEGPPTTDPCPPPKIQLDLLNHAIRQQELLSQQLDRSFEEYFTLARQAEQYKSDYEQAARDCGLWQAAITLTGFLVSNPGMNVGNLPTLVRGNLSPQGVRALEQFYNFLSLIDKVTTGDASWLLPSTSFKDFAKLPNARGGFLDAETIYDGVRSALGFLQGYAGSPSPESLLQSLRTCGAPTADIIMDDAIRYLRLLQEIQPLMEDVQETLNRLEDQDEEILNFWANYRRECLAYEACREGGDPSRCDQWPPPAAPSANP